jgi:hypothetical protein
VLRRRVQKLRALLRLAFTLLRTSGFPDRSASAGRTRQAADPARRGSGPRVPPVASGPSVPAPVTGSVPCVAPADGVCAQRSVVLSPHITVSTHAPRDPGDRGHGHLARISPRPDRHAGRPRQRLGKVWASPSTWYRLVRLHGWRRPWLRVHPAKPKIGLRTTRADEMWHIDTTVIRLLDGPGPISMP